jgi:peptidase E
MGWVRAGVYDRDDATPHRDRYRSPVLVRACKPRPRSACGTDLSFAEATLDRRSNARPRMAPERRPHETAARHLRPPTPHAAMKRIVAIGGGGFTMEDEPSLLDEYVVGLCGAGTPRICFVATASGDAEPQIARFYTSFGRFRAELSHLAFFGRPLPGAIAPDRIDEHLCQQHLVYVGGGNTRAMLAVWREWGVPQALRNALAGGTVLAGVSAGALCWFEWGASDAGSPGMRGGALRCLGFLKGSCSPHWGAEVHRRREFHAMVRRGDLPAGYGVSHGAALAFEDGRLTEVVSTGPDATAYRVELARDRLLETALPARRLVRAASPPRRPLR